MASIHIFIKLVRSVETQLVPLEVVRDMIQKTLEKSRFQDIRAGFVKQLRERSAIKVNKDAWKSLRKQLRKENANHES